MNASRILTGGGFDKISLPIAEQNREKVRLYYLKDLTQEKIEKAGAAFKQAIDKGREYKGKLEEFEKEIREKPYLLREGRTLQLIKGEETQTPEGTPIYHIELNWSDYKFLKDVKAGNFSISGKHASVVIKNVNIYFTSHCPATSKWQSAFNLPPSPPIFKGRESELTKLDEHSKKSMPIAITGLGGIGKTALVLEYANRHRDDYPSILYINGATPETINHDFLLLADNLEIPDHPLPKRLEVLKNRFNKEKSFLFIFDGVNLPESFDHLEKLLPDHDRHTIILTSRMPDESSCKLRCVLIPLVEMGEEDSVSLIQETTQQFAEAQQLCDRLGYLPLAIVHACAYIKQRNITIERFIKKFNKKKTALFAEEITKPFHEQTILTTWNMSLLQMCPAAADLLEFCAFLAPTNIPRDLLNKWVKMHNLKEDVDKLIRELRSYSMLTYSRPEVYGIHSLVQQVIRDHLSEKMKQQSFKAVISLLQAYAETFNWNSHEKREIGSFCFAQIKWIRQNYLTEWDQVEPHIKWSILRRVGIWLRFVNADLIEANEYFYQALSVSKQTLESHKYNMYCFESAIAMLNLGAVARDGANYKIGTKWVKRALKVLRNLPQTLDTSEKTLECLCELGNIVGHMKKHSEAKKIFEEAHRIANQLYEDKPCPNSAMVLEHLGDVSVALEKYQEAIDFYNEAKSIYKKISGDHSLSLSSIEAGLGNAFFGQIKYEEALDAYQLAKEKYIKVHGNEYHPTVAYLFQQIGSVYRASGEYKKSKEAYEQSHKIYSKVLGKEHVSTISVERKIKSIEKIFSLSDQTLTLTSKIERETQGIPKTILQEIPQFELRQVKVCKPMDVYIERKMNGHAFECLVSPGEQPKPLESYIVSRNYVGRKMRTVTECKEEKVGVETKEVRNDAWKENVACILRDQKNTINQLKTSLKKIKTDEHNLLDIAEVTSDLGREYHVLALNLKAIYQNKSGLEEAKKSVQYLQETLNMRKKFCMKNNPNTELFYSFYNLIIALYFLESFDPQQSHTLSRKLLVELLESHHANISEAKEKLAILRKLYICMPKVGDDVNLNNLPLLERAAVKHARDEIVSTQIPSPTYSR